SPALARRRRGHRRRGRRRADAAVEPRWRASPCSRQGLAARSGASRPARRDPFHPVDGPYRTGRLDPASGRLVDGRSDGRRPPDGPLVTGRAVGHRTAVVTGTATLPPVQRADGAGDGVTIRRARTSDVPGIRRLVDLYTADRR